jgi:TolB-like protein
MATPDPADPPRAPFTVFLSYASEDREATQAIRDALPGYGLEVWYDESALEGGDAWDQKIRRQIRECDFFMPLISARTETRHEGYFRREWRLAVERTLDMADDHTFLLPVVIDDTAQAGARVPDKFLAVQWTRLPVGQPTAAFEALCRRLAAGQGIAPPSGKELPPQARAERASRPTHRYPDFPREEPGQKVRFWALTIAWPFQSAWVFFNSFPKWVRIGLYLWLIVALLSKGCTGWGTDEHARRITPEQTRKLKQISDDYPGSLNEADVAKLGVQIAQQFAGTAAKEGEAAALMVVPFSTGQSDSAARKLAGTTFAQVYGRLAISHHGRVTLATQPQSAADASSALDLGRARHAKYVLTGTVEGEPGSQSLAVKLLSVADGTVLWTKSYPASGADPATIAADVDSAVLSLDDD